MFVFLFGTDYYSLINASEEGKLLIWMGTGRHEAVRLMGEWFQKETGVPVQVEHNDDIFESFIKTSRDGEGPDMFIWWHDSLMNLAKAGLLMHVDISKSMRKKMLPKSWEAYTVRGRLYGYPYALETIALIYNKDLVPNPPQTFEDLFRLHKDLQAKGILTFLFDYNVFYYSFPIMTSGGGYLFGKKANSDWDTTDIGINGPGAVKGTELLMRLIDQGVIATRASSPIVEAKFSKQKVAMTINGHWTLPNFKAGKVNYGVAPFPTYQGRPARPFVKVKGIVINRASKNVELSKEFIENYFLSSKGLRIMHELFHLGVPAHKQFLAEIAYEPNVRGFRKMVDEGILMPNVPRMPDVWQEMANALDRITSKKQPIQESLNEAVNYFRDKIQEP